MLYEPTILFLFLLFKTFLHNDTNLFVPMCRISIEWFFNDFEMEPSFIILE